MRGSSGWAGPGRERAARECLRTHPESDCGADDVHAPAAPLALVLLPLLLAQPGVVGARADPSLEAFTAFRRGGLDGLRHVDAVALRKAVDDPCRRAQESSAGREPVSARARRMRREPRKLLREARTAADEARRFVHVFVVSDESNDIRHHALGLLPHVVVQIRAVERLFGRNEKEDQSALEQARLRLHAIREKHARKREEENAALGADPQGMRAMRFLIPAPG